MGRLTDLIGTDNENSGAPSSLSSRLFGDTQTERPIPPVVSAAQPAMPGDFRQIAQHENAGRVGRDAGTGLWAPHDSIEGGTPTIGYGHKMTEAEHAGNFVVIGGEQVPLEGGLTDEQVEQLLQQDAAPQHRYVSHQFSRLNANQRNAVTSLIYNIGRGAFQRSKAAKALREYQATGSAGSLAQFTELAFGDRGFNMAAGQRRAGLVRRRQAELAQFNTPVPEGDVRSSVAQAVGTNPDQYAQGRRDMATLGATTLEPALDDPTLRTAAREEEILNAVADTPVTKAFITDPNNARLAHDEVEALTWVERTIQGFQHGRIMRELGVQGSRLRRTRSPKVQERVDRLEEMLAATQDSRAGDFGDFLAGTAQLLGQMAASLGDPRASTRIGGGMVVGGTAGSVLPGVGTVTGAAAGGGAGFTMHLAADAFEVEGGFAYLDMIDQGIDHETASWASTGVGIVNSGLELVGVVGVTKPMTNAIKGKLRKQIRFAFQDKRVVEVVRGFVTDWGAAQGAEVTTEVLQEGVNIAAEEIAKAHSDGQFEEVSAEEIRERLVGIAVDTFKAMAIPATVIAGTGVRRRTTAEGRPAATVVRDPVRAKQIMDQAQGVVARMKIQQRDPAAAAQHTAAVLENNGIESVGVPAQVIIEAAEASGRPTAQVLNEMGVLDEVIAAAEDNSTVQIPAYGLASAVLPDTPLYAHMSPHMQIGETPSVVQHMASVRGASEALLQRLERNAIRPKLKGQVAQFIEQFAEGDAVDIAQALEQQPPQVQQVLNSLIEQETRRKVSVTDTINRGRRRTLENSVSQLDRQIDQQASLLEQRQQEGRATTRIEAKLDKLIQRRDDLQQQVEGLKQKPAIRRGSRAQQQREEVTVRASQLERLAVRITEDSVRAARRGFREGIRTGRRNVRAAQRLVNDLIDNSGLPPASRDKFRRAVANIQDQSQLQRQLPVIQARVVREIERVRKKQLGSALKKTVKTARTRNRAGQNPRGRLTPEISRMVDTIDRALKMKKEEAQQTLANRLGNMENLPDAGTVLENQVLALVADPDSVSSQQLESIVLTLDSFVEAGRAVNRVNAIARERRQQQLRDRVVNAIGEAPAKPAGRVTKFALAAEATGFLGWSGAWWNKLQRVFTLKDATEVNALVDELSLFDESRALERGRQKRIEKFAKLAMEAVGVNTQRKLIKRIQRDMTDRVNVGRFTHSDGQLRTIEMSRSELRKRWMELQDPGLNKSIRSPKGNAYTQEIIDSIRRELTEEDIRLVNAQLEFYRDYYADINAAYEQAFGVSLPQIENYSPIRRVLDDPDLDPFMSGILHQGGTIPGSLKSRAPSVRKLRDQADISVLYQHVQEMEYFMAMHQKVADLNAVFMGDGGRVMNLIQEKFGDRMARTIRADLDYFARKGNMVSVAGDKLFVQLMRNFGVAQLAVKPQIALKQMASFSALAENVKARHFVEGLLRFAANPRAALRLLNQSEYFRNRGINIDRDFQDITADPVGGNVITNFLGRNPSLVRVLMLNIRFGDKVAIAIGGFAHVHGRMKAGATQAEALRSFEKISTRTQQSADIDQVSEAQRGGPFMRIMVQFMSSANALTRGEYSALVEGFRGRINKREMFKRLIIYHLVIPNMIQFIANGFEWEDEDQLRASLLGSLNGWLILGDIFEAVINASISDGDQIFDLESRHPFAFIEDFIRSADDIAEEGFPTFEEFLEGSKAIEKGTKGAGAVTGLPFNTIYNMMRGIGLAGDNRKAEEGVKLMLGYSPYTIKNTAD